GAAPLLTEHSPNAMPYLAQADTIGAAHRDQLARLTPLVEQVFWLDQASVAPDHSPVGLVVATDLQGDIDGAEQGVATRNAFAGVASPLPRVVQQEQGLPTLTGRRNPGRECSGDCPVVGLVGGQNPQIADGVDDDDVLLTVPDASEQLQVRNAKGEDQTQT